MTSVIRSPVIFLLPLSTKHTEKHVDLFALEFGSVPILWYFYLFFILLDLTDYNDNRSVRGWGAVWCGMGIWGGVGSGVYMITKIYNLFSGQTITSLFFISARYPTIFYKPHISNLCRKCALFRILNLKTTNVNSLDLRYLI